MFMFACFSGGTPRESDFVHLDRTNAAPLVLAHHARVSPLAQRLVDRNALAVIGHVERAWTTSFATGSRRELAHFEAAIADIIAGVRLGAALEPFGQRYADLATILNTVEDRLTTLPDPPRIARLWAAVNDARGYALFGDPAVRFAT